MRFKNTINAYFFEDDRSFDVVIEGKTKQEVKEFDVQKLIDGLGKENNLKTSEVVLTSTIEKNGKWEDTDEYFGSYDAKKTTKVA